MYKRQLQRPVVICIALGSSQGGHDGHGALSSYLDSLSQLPWTGVSISAGNEGIAGRHYFGTAGTAPFQDDVELLAGAGDTEFALEIWSSYSRLSIEILAPNHESTQQIFPSILDCRRLQFIFHECEIWINNIIFEQETGDQLILIRFKKMLPGIWTCLLYTSFCLLAPPSSWASAPWLSYWCVLGLVLPIWLLP